LVNCHGPIASAPLTHTCDGRVPRSPQSWPPSPGLRRAQEMPMSFGSLRSPIAAGCRARLGGRYFKHGNIKARSRSRWRVAVGTRSVWRCRHVSAVASKPCASWDARSAPCQLLKPSWTHAPARPRRERHQPSAAPSELKGFRDGASDEATIVQVLHTGMFVHARSSPRSVIAGDHDCCCCSTYILGSPGICQPVKINGRYSPATVKKDCDAVGGLWSRNGKQYFCENAINGGGNVYCDNKTRRCTGTVPGGALGPRSNTIEGVLNIPRGAAARADGS
jgi:hypothetical protein